MQFSCSKLIFWASDPIQSNPWMNPIHTQLWYAVAVLHLPPSAKCNCDALYV